MDKKSLRKQIEVVYGYAWEIRQGNRWVLCHWMQPNMLADQRGKPSDEARLVPVKMMRRGGKR